jgi:hypothetical protein
VCTDGFVEELIDRGLTLEFFQPLHLHTPTLCVGGALRGDGHRERANGCARLGRAEGAVRLRGAATRLGHKTPSHFRSHFRRRSRQWTKKPASGVPRARAETAGQDGAVVGTEQWWGRSAQLGRLDGHARLGGGDKSFGFR